MVDSLLKFCSNPCSCITSIREEWAATYVLFVERDIDSQLMQGDQNSIDELNLSLQKLNETTKDAEIWLTGDFNAHRHVVYNMHPYITCYDYLLQLASKVMLLSRIN